MKTIDVEAILRIRTTTSWPEKRIRRDVPRPVSVIDFLKSDHIWPSDRIRSVLLGGFVEHVVVCRFVVDCAKKALIAEQKSGREPDARLWCAIRTAEKLINGEDGDLLLSETSATEAVNESNKKAVMSVSNVCKKASKMSRLSREGNFEEATLETRKAANAIAKASAVDASRCAAESVFYAVSFINKPNILQNAVLAASKSADREAASCRAEVWSGEKWDASRTWVDEISKQCSHLCRLVEDFERSSQT